MTVLVRAARRARLDYDGFLYVCQQARRKLKLARPARVHKLPHLLPGSELKRFFRSIRTERVQGELERRFGLRPAFAGLLVRFLSDGDTLAEGISTSPLFANIVCLPLDLDATYTAACQRRRLA